MKLEISCAENSNLVIFPGVGAIDLRKWTYDEAFEQLYGPVRGNLNNLFSKNSNVRGVARWGGGDVEALI